MKVVGLLSGGKDSCYNLVHCVRNGHDIVALASLRPAEGKEEIDSYMYQTVGQDAIETVAKAMELPLIRKVITGSALEQRSEYGSRETIAVSVVGDETEDLYQLLATVKAKFPAVEAVSVGAILSNYQRVRVEHVCRRLGLTPLAYLWQRDQRELLAEMIDAGLEAVLIKVAGAGLKAAHLGKSLSEMHSTLLKLHDQYGSHVCGEGGEYESLTLDCPLFKSRIVLKKVETVHISSDKIAPVAYLRIKEATLEKKGALPGTTCTIPPLLDYKMDQILDTISPNYWNIGEEVQPPPPLIHEHGFPQAVSRKTGRWVALSNVQANNTPQQQQSVKAEVEACFSIVRTQLAKHKLSLHHIAHVNLFLSSMELFSEVNSVYSTMFGSNPPTRAAVAVDLPDPTRIRLDCLAFTEDPEVNDERQSVHVQGISYWAPANIGPYSQAISIGEQVLVSGQIGLVPAKMAFPTPRSVAREAALAFQHVDRIVEAIKANPGGGWSGVPECALVWIVSRGGLVVAKKAWSMYAEASHWKLPVLFAGCKTIPKNGLIEIQMVMHTGRCPSALGLNVNDNKTAPLASKYAKGRYPSPSGASVVWETTTIGSSTMTIIGFRGTSGTCLSHIKAVPDLVGSLARPLSVRLFHKPHLNNEHTTTPVQALFGAKDGPVPITLVPCRFLSMPDEEKLDCAMMIFSIAE